MLLLLRFFSVMVIFFLLILSFQKKIGEEFLLVGWLVGSGFFFFW